MIRKNIARLTSFAAVALLMGAQSISHADRVVSYALYGNNGVATLYSEADVRNVGGVTDPDSSFYVTDGLTFEASASCDTVKITKDKDGTVHTIMQGYGVYMDYDGNEVDAYLQENLTRLPNGASTVSVSIKSLTAKAAMFDSNVSVAGTAAQTPMVQGVTYFLPGR